MSAVRHVPDHVFIVSAVRDGGDTPVALFYSLCEARSWAQQQIRASEPNRADADDTYQFSDAVLHREQVREKSNKADGCVSSEFQYNLDQFEPWALTITGFGGNEPFFHEVVDFNTAYERHELIL